MREYLSEHIDFTDYEYRMFMSMAKRVTFGKSDFLITPKKVTELFFVREGLIRGYRIIDGVEMTHHFFVKNYFATDLQSFLTDKAGDLYLEALVDTSVYQFNKNALLKCYQAYPKFEKLRYVMAENAYLIMNQRVIDLQTKDLKMRYKNLVEINPGLFNLVPQKYIASYLGVKPQSLSRIKYSLKP